MRLREIAHSRTGDKGNTSNISVIAFEPKDYPLLIERVTAERVAAHFAAIATGPVRRYELPNVGALNFVIEGALGGGVTRALDARRPRQIAEFTDARSGDLTQPALRPVREGTTTSGWPASQAPVVRIRRRLPRCSDWRGPPPEERLFWEIRT